MKLQNLQVLRAIAALLVCGFHFRNHINGSIKFGDLLFIKGSIGVPIFFIISGFIMTYTTQKYGNNVILNLKKFLLRRWIRVIPLYYLLTFLWMIIGGSFSLYFTDEEVFNRLYKSLLFIPIKNDFPVLFVGWSLNFEMFFYFIFAVSFLFVSYRYFFVFLFFIIALITPHFISIENPFLAMVTSSDNMYFLIGILYALFLNKLNKINKKILMIIFFCSLIFFLGYYFNIIVTTNYYVIMAFTSLFVLGFLNLDIVKIKPHPFLVYLGDISYSIYLIHPFVEIVSRKYISTSNVMVSIFFFIGLLSTVILLSSFTYKYVELYISDYLKEKLKLT